ncbi:MAG: succinate dehydrogenase/fumarate reductase iron-sulfur subunit [Campylobacterales bacterium]|nr:succinate dehydrogenase/fumarate reductase iron-sulfur subunit [Campylobacterales bacterium]
MKIEIFRESGFVSYERELKDITLLKFLEEIKTKEDNSLAFSSGCRSSVCGSCAVRVNGKEVLACSYKVKDGDKVEPLKNCEVLRDLAVNMDKAYSFNAKAKAWMQEHTSTQGITQDDEKRNEIQSDCILCSSCYSACPVYSVNESFLGPFALTRSWKYVTDKRQDEEYEKIEAVQNSGIWDCTLCNECTVVCPQGISSKADIEKLRAKSAAHGFMDPNFGSFGGGFGGFGGGFDGSPVF